MRFVSILRICWWIAVLAFLIHAEVTGHRVLQGRGRRRGRHGHDHPLGQDAAGGRASCRIHRAGSRRNPDERARTASRSSRPSSRSRSSGGRSPLASSGPKRSSLCQARRWSPCRCHSSGTSRSSDGPVPAGQAAEVQHSDRVTVVAAIRTNSLSDMDVAALISMDVSTHVSWRKGSLVGAPAATGGPAERDDVTTANCTFSPGRCLH